MTAPVILTWYLIIANPNGGLLSIPQINQAQCLAQAEKINELFRDPDSFCVYGKPQ